VIRVDIVRLESGKIVEHWDVQQEEVLPTASGHPMFAAR
jgi:predicted SnoaL-like aldol condensation-catalyzing enzyme